MSVMDGLKHAIWIQTRPPLSRFKDELGDCVICGATTRFLYNPWVIGPDVARDLPSAIADGYRRRESMWCSHCHASQRERGLTSALLCYYGGGAPSLGAALPVMAGLDIAEINRFNAAHQFLAMLPGIRYVEYPDEDIHNLSFAGESFDLVIRSDTLEHVADPARGLLETLRVLRPGGRHIITVPIRPDLAKSHPRTGLADVHHGRPPGLLRHFRRPTADMLVRTDFGRDFMSQVEACGFEVEFHGEGVDVVFVARRPL